MDKDVDLLASRLEQISAEAETGAPIYVLSASVLGDSRIKRFNQQLNIDTIVSRFRARGFDLSFNVKPVAGPDGSFDLFWGRTKHLRIYQDGGLLIRVAADRDFLGWSTWEETDPCLNIKAVVELHASFVNSMANVIGRLDTRPTSVQFRYSLRNGVLRDSARTYIRDHITDPYQMLVRHELELDPAEGERVFPTDDVVDWPNVVAHRLVEDFVSAFDFPIDKLPFVRSGTNGLEVDVQSL